MSKKKNPRPWHSLAEEVEGHVFEPNPKNDFVCVHCGEPRALHADNGFKPTTTPSVPVDSSLVEGEPPRMELDL